MLVWDDEIELTEENTPAILDGPGPSRLSPRTPNSAIAAVLAPVTEPRPRRSHSVSDFPPPPMRRVSSEFAGAMRPVSFSAKFSRVHPATTGVTVLEHMERLDAVEASLKRIGIEEDAVDEEEVDVGTMRSKPPKKQRPAGPPLSPSATSERLPALLEDDIAAEEGAPTEDGGSVNEEDLVAMSKSMPHLEQSPPLMHARWTSHDERHHLDWMDAASSSKKRMVIAEVRLLHPILWLL